MDEIIFEETSTLYDPKLKLSQMAEYIAKLPKDAKSYVKMLDFKKDQVCVYNVSDILISESIGKGKAAEDKGKKVVRIVYTGDEESKVCTCKKFQTLCSKIAKALKGVDPKEVLVQVSLAGKEIGKQFRFFYDSSSKFVVLVRGTAVNGAQKFVEAHKEDLVNIVNAPAPTKEPKLKKAKAPKKNSHDGYELVSSTDDFGHRIKLWKKVDTDA